MPNLNSLLRSPVNRVEKGKARKIDVNKIRDKSWALSYRLSSWIIKLSIDEPKNPKNLEAFFLETFLDAKPGSSIGIL